MKVELKGKVEATRWAAFAELAWMERRPEIGMLCKHAIKNKNQITTSLIAKVLPGLPETGAANIIEQLNMLGICDPHGALTRIGKAAAEDSFVPVPEQGSYEMWIAEHPVFGCRLIHATRIDAQQEDRRGGPEPVQIPRVPDADISTPSALDRNERIVFRGFPPVGRSATGLRRNDTSKLEVRWVLDTENDKSSWEFSGTLDVPGKGVRSVIPVPERKDYNLADLMDYWGYNVLANYGRWDEEEKCLRIKENQCDLREKRSFRKAFPSLELLVPGIATFPQATLSDVAIAPENQREAQAWATALFHDELNRELRYWTRQHLRTLFAEQIEETILEQFEITLKSHTDMLSEVAPKNELFWSLAAATDLSPTPCLAEELESLQLGANQGAPSRRRQLPATGNQFSVKLHDRRSMAEVAGRLLGTTPPSKLLICDKHVRGERSLKLLSIIVQEVRAISARCHIEVWTENPSDTDSSEISKIIGRAPKRYLDVFGKVQPPHDRYLLFVDQKGERHAWQMSNTLLGSKWDREISNPDGQTLLHWKDLLAIRQPVEAISDVVALWFEGGIA